MSFIFMRLVGVTLLVLTPWLLPPPRAAAAAVYCTRPGVPAGCVARPRPAVGAPGVRAIPGVGAGAPGAGVEPANRGGAVNRAGLR